MGQLTVTEGPKPHSKRVKCQRRMPTLDPDLQAATTHRMSPRIDNEVVVDATEATISPGVEDANHTKSVPAGDIDPGNARKGLQNGDNVLPSVEASIHPTSVVYQPLRPRQPLEFGRTISEDLMMVRAERPATPAEDDSSISASTSSPMSSFHLPSSSEGHVSKCDDDEDGSEDAHGCEKRLASGEPSSDHCPISPKANGNVDAIFPPHVVEQTRVYKSSSRLSPSRTNGVRKARKDHRLGLQRAGTDKPRASVHKQRCLDWYDNVDLGGADVLFRDSRASSRFLRDLTGLPCRKLHSEAVRSFTA